VPQVAVLFSVTRKALYVLVIILINPGWEHSKTPILPPKGAKPLPRCGGGAFSTCPSEGKEIERISF